MSFNPILKSLTLPKQPSFAVHFTVLLFQLPGVFSPVYYLSDFIITITTVLNLISHRTFFFHHRVFQTSSLRRTHTVMTLLSLGLRPFRLYCVTWLFLGRVDDVSKMAISFFFF